MISNGKGRKLEDVERVQQTIKVGFGASTLQTY